MATSHCVACGEAYHTERVTMSYGEVDMHNHHCDPKKLAARDRTMMSERTGVPMKAGKSYDDRLADGFSTVLWR